MSSGWMHALRRDVCKMDYIARASRCLISTLLCERRFNPLLILGHARHLTLRTHQGGGA